MNRFFLLVIVICGVAAPLLLLAQPVVVDVRLSQPPPNQLRIADLWRIELNNRSGRTVRIYLHGTAEEMSIPDGIIADARSKEFDLPPGVMVVTGATVQPVTVDESNDRYRDALLTTGNVPTGEYQICCEAVEVETQAVVGRDCKFVSVNRISVPILIAPPDESDVVERYPVLTWMNSVPPAPGLIIKYHLRMAEIFGTQTPQDAMLRNPAWLDVRSLTRTIFQYPVSTRTFVEGQRYAWMIEAYEERGAMFVPLGESEVWWFRYSPMKAEEPETVRTTGSTAVVTPSADCPGENWDFEIGSLACWEVTGAAFVDDPINDAHPVIGNVGQNGKYWVSSFGLLDADIAKGAMLSQEFHIQNSVVGFLFGGYNDEGTGVELLIEKNPKDTFKLLTRELPGTAKSWWVANSTSARNEAGASERLAPVDWDVLKYLNRAARILVRDSSEKAHVNIDYFRFYDKEKLDSVKFPVLVMAAGENHSLVATPDEKPTKSLQDKFKLDASYLKAGSVKLADVNVVNETSPKLKGMYASSLQASANMQGNVAPENEQPPSDISLAQTTSEVSKIQSMLLLASLAQKNIVWGWGDNSDNSVGPSLPGIVKEPAKVKNVSEVQALAAGPWHSFAVGKDGSVKAWGMNEWAELGTNDRAGKGTPTTVNGIAGATQVATGAFHSLGVTKTGTLYVWGWNRFHGCGGAIPVYTNASTGQIDSTVFFKAPIPHLVVKSGRAVAAGEAHSLVLTVGGNIVSFGVNGHGQTGQPLDEPFTPSPKSFTIGSAARNVIAVAAGFDHSLALSRDGKVWAWGGNASGQLGDGTVKDTYKPVQVKTIGGVRAIAAGAGFSLALDSNGVVWGWGNNVLGQLGDGTRVGKYEPVQIIRLDAVQGIVAGSAHAMAVRADGGLWTWGTNDYGQLGEGPVTNLIPVPLDPPLGPMRVERLASP